MKNRSRGFIGITVIVLIALAVIGGGAYLYSTQKTQVDTTFVLDQSMSSSTASNTNIETKEQNQPQQVVSSFQYNFELKNTPDYLISFSVKNCDDTTCNGSAVININDAQSKVLIQTIKSVDLYFFKDTLAKTSTSDTVLYDEQGPVIVGDFNFDGSSDLAVRNGNNSGYGGPSYDIYLFNNADKKFTLSQSLTQLASQNLGMFFVDQTKRLLTTYSKSGCCWHETDQYQIVNNQPILIYTLIEDAGGMAKVKEGNMLITEKKLVNGTWVTTTKEVNQKDYYESKR